MSTEADVLGAALRRAYNLGQVYWQQADSEYTSQHRKADETQAKFDALLSETVAALARAVAAEPEQNPAPQAGAAESYADLWNALQAIDTAAVSLPGFEVRHEGGIEAVTKNIVEAIQRVAAHPTEQPRQDVLAQPVAAEPSIEDLCARIKAADDAAADGDYMLDSDDCIKVLRGTWKGPLAMDKPDPPTPA